MHLIRRRLITSTYSDKCQGDIDEKLGQLLSFKVLGEVSARNPDAALRACTTHNLPLKHVADLVQQLLRHLDTAPARVSVGG